MLPTSANASVQMEATTMSQQHLRKSDRAQKHYAHHPGDGLTDEKAETLSINDVRDPLSCSSGIAGSPGHSSRPTRKSKQEAAARLAEEMASSVPQNAMIESLAAMSADERNEWHGWVEIESEPSFFNVILQDLGVQDVKVQELFALDESSLSDLPKPVFGLIFLCQYGSEEDEDGGAEPAENIWFANQIAHNACATVALLNILMNASEIEIGDELRRFREDTRSLPSAVRGHKLSRDNFIRRSHNAFARKIDLLNADLSLQNRYDAAQSKSRHKIPPHKLSSEITYHFIAYLPAAGQVWELDGLASNPVCLGPLSSQEDWMALATSAIQARMLQRDDISNVLLAVCQTPLNRLRQQLATSIRSLGMLSRRAASLDSWQAVAQQCQWSAFHDPIRQNDLDRYKLNKESLSAMDSDSTFIARVSQAGFTSQQGLELAQQLLVEQQQLCAEYAAEEASLEQDVQRVTGRRKDFTPAIHAWLQKLADRGHLQKLVEQLPA